MRRPAVSPSHILRTLTETCLALPESTRDVSGQHATFKVRKKVFAYYLHDHHGDGIISVCFKMPPGAGPALIASDGYHYYSPAYIGPRGWVGYRLDLGETDWDEVEGRVTASYRQVAPKRLLTLLGE
jgi:predicted DNA-binding protein (MmcQ/YjbR family)